jgi:hypothetical protein
MGQAPNTEVARRIRLRGGMIWMVGGCWVAGGIGRWRSRALSGKAGILDRRSSG